jgi:hypothetical protein
MLNNFDFMVHRLDPRLPRHRRDDEPVAFTQGFYPNLRVRRNATRRERELQLALNVPLHRLAR